MEELRVNPENTRNTTVRGTEATREPIRDRWNQSEPSKSQQRGGKRQVTREGNLQNKAGSKSTKTPKHNSQFD